MNRHQRRAAAAQSDGNESPELANLRAAATAMIRATPGGPWREYGVIIVHPTDTAMMTAAREKETTIIAPDGVALMTVSLDAWKELGHSVPVGKTAVMMCCDGERVSFFIDVPTMN